MGVGWFDRTWIRYGFTIGVVAVAFLLRLVLTKWVGPGLPTFVTFYPAVMLVAIVFGLWAGLLATAMVAMISAYWILPPEGFAIELLSDLVGLCVFFGHGCVDKRSSRILSSHPAASSREELGTCKSE